MKSEIKQLPKSRTRITISLTPDELKEHRGHVLDHYVASTKIAGFRQGKAPKAMIEAHVGAKALQQETVSHTITDAYYEAVQEHKLHPLGSPTISSVSEDGGLAFIAEVDCMPEVKVKEWKTIRVKSEAAKAIEASDVDKVLKHLQKERASLHEADRPLAIGDFASISYVGSLNGVTQDNMTSKNHPLVMGEGTLIPGFESALEGMKPGESKTFPITFPKDYYDKNIKGKKAEFTVTLDSMKALELPDVDEAFAKDFGKDSVSALREAITEQLVQEADTEAKAKSQDEVLLKLVERTNVDLPQVVIEDEISRIIDAMQQRMSLKEEQFAQYLQSQNKTIDTLRQEATDQAIKNATIGLALGTIMEELGIDPHEKEAVSRVIDQLVESATGKP